MAMLVYQRVPPQKKTKHAETIPLASCREEIGWKTEAKVVPQSRC